MQKGVAAIKPAHNCSQGVPEMGTGCRYQPWDGRRASSERGMENSSLLWEGTICPYWDCTSSDCWHRWIDSLDAQQQRLVVVAGGGRKGKTIKCKIRYFVSALMVVVSHGHSEEPLYSFPCSRSSVVPFIMWLMITGRVCIISIMMYR